MWMIGSIMMLQADHHEDLTRQFVRGDAGVQSMSVLHFGPEGILFVGDAKAGKVVALDLNDRTPNDSKEGFRMLDIETTLGNLLGVEAKGVVIHDVVVNPISQNIYLAVSRSDANQLGFWKSANDLAYASLLLKVDPKGNIEEVDLTDISHSAATVPSVINPGKQNWRKSDLRTEAITDIEYANGKLYVTGLSNEEFASALLSVN